MEASGVSHGPAQHGSRSSSTIDRLPHEVQRSRLWNLEDLSILEQSMKADDASTVR